MQKYDFHDRVTQSFIKKLSAARWATCRVVNENLISQVMINLIKNAIEAIGNRTDGRIEIRSYCNEAEEVLIEIVNNGAPIAPDVAQQIFVLFFATKQGGNGIGLSLSLQIMRLSGGNIILKPTTRTDSFTRFLLRFK